MNTPNLDAATTARIYGSFLIGGEPGGGKSVPGWNLAMAYPALSDDDRPTMAALDLNGGHDDANPGR
jgi:hypothetical protein